MGAQNSPNATQTLQICSYSSIPGSKPTPPSQKDLTFDLLDKILNEFGLQRDPDGSQISLINPIPTPSSTKSTAINLSLVGAIPSLANAIAASQIYEARGGCPQTIEVDLARGHNYLDPDMGMTPTINGQNIPLDVVAGNPFLFGVYETKDGRHAVPSAVYVDLVYKWSTFLSCGVNVIDVAAAIKRWNSHDLEAAAERAGLPFALVQSPETWAAIEQGRHLSKLPIVPIQKTTNTPPKPLSLHPRRPLEGLKVLCATHAIAGPSAGRTLAEHGATVLQILYTHGFEHSFVYTYANLGTLSTRLDLNKASDLNQLWSLIATADVYIDSYRSTALSKFGLTDEALHERNPSLIISHVRVYGTSGPWAEKAGFDMQGSASSGMMSVCGDGLSGPRWPPGQVINDYTTGYYGALAIQAAVLRRMREGGGYVLSPSLCGTAMSIVKYFQTSEEGGKVVGDEGRPLPPLQVELRTGLGLLRTLRPLPWMSETRVGYEEGERGETVLPAMGSCLPVWPGEEGGYDVRSVNLVTKEKLGKVSHEHVAANVKKLKEVARLYQATSDS